MRFRAVMSVAAVVVGASCSADPVYLGPTPAAVEVGGALGNDSGASSLRIPIRLETEAQFEDRVAMAMDLGLDVAAVPSVRRDEITMELEWTIKNLDDEEAIATLTVLGANEFFA